MKDLLPPEPVAKRTPANRSQRRRPNRAKGKKPMRGVLPEGVNYWPATDRGTEGKP